MAKTETVPTRLGAGQLDDVPRTADTVLNLRALIHREDDGNGFWAEVELGRNRVPFRVASEVASIRQRLDYRIREGLFDPEETLPKGMENLDGFLVSLVLMLDANGLPSPQLDVEEDGEVSLSWRRSEQTAYLDVWLETMDAEWSIQRGPNQIGVQRLHLAEGSEDWTTLECLLGEHHGN